MDQLTRPYKLHVLGSLSHYPCEPLANMPIAMFGSNRVKSYLLAVSTLGI